MMPEDEYLRRLGRAVYAVAYLEWLVFEVIRLLNPAIGLADLAKLPGGQIVKHLRKAAANCIDPETKAELSQLCHEFGLLYRDRNDIVHARPATTGTGEQRLYRWAPGAEKQAGFIDDARLDVLVDGSLNLARKLDSIRLRLRRPIKP